jgi:peroxiredoxin
MSRWAKRASLLAVVLTLLVGRCYAAGVQIGDKAPLWSALTGVDGAQHSLRDFESGKDNLVVLVFTCNTCPVAVAYEDRLVALQRDYQGKGVQFVAINVKHGAADGLDKMKERAAEKDFNFPYLSDPSQASGRAYGAQVTPHVFVIDQGRKIAYIGAIDDSKAVDKVTKHFLRDALDALLAGQKPPLAQTKAFGCGIKYQ